MINLLIWYNYRTEEYDYLDVPSDFHPYIPQDQVVQRLFDLYLERGDDPLDAYIAVMKKCVGKDV